MEELASKPPLKRYHQFKFVGSTLEGALAPLLRALDGNMIYGMALVEDLTIRRTDQHCEVVVYGVEIKAVG